MLCVGGGVVDGAGDVVRNDAVYSCDEGGGFVSFFYLGFLSSKDIYYHGINGLEPGAV